jgi:hypothetical protein
MLSLPPVFKVEMENVAEPLFSVLVPIAVEPCLKVTVSPFGGAPIAEETTAVKVTLWP